MKKKFHYIIFIYLLSVSLSFSQPGEILITESEPEYPGGYKEFQNYIVKNFNLDSIPEIKDRLCYFPSKFYFEFIINEDGMVSDIKLLKPKEYITVEKEIRRIITTTHPWTPKKENGKAVKSKMTFPIKICFK